MAIDPAALDAEVLLPNVTHVRKQGSQAVAEVQELMQGQQVGAGGTALLRLVACCCHGGCAAVGCPYAHE